ncbi:hypothetical protein Trydic_g16128 [Trypoxylus dichotomus]
MGSARRPVVHPEEISLPIFRNVRMLPEKSEIATEGYASTDLGEKAEHWINTQPYICFNVAFEYYSDLNVRRKCLNILLKRSAIAEALSVQNDLELPIFEVNVTKLITAIRNENPEQVDWIVAALCLFLIGESEIEIDIETATRIASNMLTSPYKDDGYIYALVGNTYKQFEKMLHRLHSPVTLITSNLIIVAWYPFRNGFNGIARYSSGNTTENDYLKKFTSNQILKQENLRLALYVPYEFLEDLVKNSSRVKNDLFIIMYIHHVYFPTDVLDEINLLISGYCKRNELPILKVRYESDSEEYELGREYFDSANERWECILSRPLKFVKLPEGGFFESAKLHFCLRRKIGETYFPQTPFQFLAYPENFCVNGNGEIPYLVCWRDSWSNPGRVDLQCKNDYNISINTRKIYKLATECYNSESFKNGEVLRIMNSPSLAYIDMKMFFDILNCLNQFVGGQYGYDVNYVYEDFSAIFDSINKLLEYSRRLPKEYLNSTSLHKSIVVSLFIIKPNRNIFRADDNYIYQRFLPSPNPTIGLIVYKRGSGSFKEYEVKYLTRENVSSGYASDQSVEAIIYFTGAKNISADCFSSVFIARHNLFPENDTVTARSRGIVIKRCFPFEFRIFLRVIDPEESWRLNHYTGEGYWLSIPPSRNENSFIVYIGETNTYDYCHSTRNIEMWELLYGGNTYRATERVTARKIDLLSMISMAINNAESKTGAEEIFNKYSSTFKLFRMFGAIASMLGIVTMFMTGLVLRNWHKTRFYTIQLTVILAFQTAMYIVEAQIGEIPQIATKHLINMEPYKCFNVVIQYFVDLNTKRECLCILRKMSSIADALSIQNEPGLPRFEVNITKLIIAVNNEHLEEIDWITAAACLYLNEGSKLEIDIETATQIATNMLASSLKDNRLDSPVTLITSNLMIAAWYPFRNGFNGIARYTSVNTSESDYLKKFSSDETLKQDNLHLALYVPYEFLEDLVQNSSSKVKNDLFIIVYVQHVYDGSSTDVLDDINIKIPAYCKRNELPILRVQYANDSRQYELGKEYFDPTNGRSLCVLSTPLTFMKLREGVFFESAKMHYCMRRRIGETYFPQTRVLLGVHPENFCVNGNAKIPYLVCKRVSWVNPSGMDLECKDDYSISINTRKLYKMATECYNYEGFKSSDAFSIMDSPSLEYIDMKMFFDILDCLNEFVTDWFAYSVNYVEENYNAIFDCLNKILEYSKKLPMEYINSTSMHKSIARSLSILQHNSATFRADDNYIYQRLLPSSTPIIGLVVYKRGGGSFKEYKIKVIDLEGGWSLNHYVNEGYWLDASSSFYGDSFIVYIGENGSYNYCDVTRNVEMWTYMLGGSTVVYKPTFSKKIDLLSMILMAINNAESRTGTEEIIMERYVSTDLDQGADYFMNMKSDICFQVFHKYYYDFDIRKKCLSTLRKMSFTAEAPSVQKEPVLPMFEVNITKFMMAISNVHLEQIDWITAALYLHLIVEGEIEIEIEVVTQIVSNMLKSSFKGITYTTDTLIYAALRQFERILERLEHPVTLITSNLMIAAWYPFRYGFNGIARYRSVNISDDGYLKQFSSNQTLKQENLRLGLYIPYEFLENLAQNSSPKARNDLLIIMYVRHVYDPPDMVDEINLKVPAHCKRNELPILRVRYENDSQEYEFGREYFDSILELPWCVLSRFLKFKKLPKGGFYESAKYHYCMRRRNGETYFPQTPVGFDAYSKNFCVNRNAEIPYLHCGPSSWSNPTRRDLECRNDYRTSISTSKIYKMATECYNYEGFTNGDVLNIMNLPSLEYIDMKMFFDVLDCLAQFVGRGNVYNMNYADGNYNAIFDNLNKILEYSTKLPREYLNSISVHRSIALSLSVLKPALNMFRADDNYIYQRLVPSSGPSIGLVVYKRGGDSFKEYEVKYLTPDNVSSSYALDQSVEIIIERYVSKDLDQDTDYFINMEPYICFQVFYKYYYNLNVRKKCLSTLRKMSFIAEALSVQKKPELPMFEVNITKLITAISNEHLAQIDWITAALCLYLIVESEIEIEIEVATQIVSNMLRSSFKGATHTIGILIDAALGQFDRILERLEHPVTLITSNLMIAAWYPFRNGFNGIARYRSVNISDDGYLKLISSNQIPEEENLRLALYTPYEFLQNLAQNSSPKARNDLLIIAYVRHVYDPPDMVDEINLKVPAHCKRNDLPILRVRYENDSQEYEFGREYFDSILELPWCILSGFLKFRKLPKGGFYESAKDHYCMRRRNGETYFAQTPVGFDAYTKNFCVNKNAEIPYLHCGPSSWSNPTKRELECRNDYRTSISTSKIYKMATECYNYEGFTNGDVLNIMNSPSLEYIDMKMFFDVLDCLAQFVGWGNVYNMNYVDGNYNAIFDNLNKILEYSTKLPREYLNSTSVHRSIALSLSVLKPAQDMFRVDDNYIYHRIIPSSDTSIGLVVYKRGGDSFKEYEVKYLTQDNVSSSYALDQSVEVIIYYVTDKRRISESCFSSVFIARHNLFPENDTIKVRSRSIVVRRCSPLEFKIFVRVVDRDESWGLTYYVSEGYWLSISPSYYENIFTVYIAETDSYNYCVNTRSTEMWAYLFDGTTYKATERITAKKIDPLSTISMTVIYVGVGSEEIYNRYLSTFKLLKIFGTISSILGIMTLFTTALVLDNWLENRSYTIQLTIILALQTVLSIVEAQLDEIGQVGAFISYYCILSEFCWISLVGFAVLLNKPTRQQFKAKLRGLLKKREQLDI